MGGTAATGDGDAGGDGDGDGPGDGDGDSDSGGGSGASPGDGDGDGDGTGGSAPSGCGTSSDLETGTWLEQPALSVAGDERSWSVRLPEGYDPSQSYPVVFLFHGCGGETDIFPIESEMGGEAILVRGVASSSDGCWLSLSNSNETFFVSMLESVTELTCIDDAKVFAVGYDSGADVVNRIGCTRAYLVHATATVAGENALTASPVCTGPVAAMLIHDEDDGEDPFSEGEEVRDRLIDQNFCVTDGIPSAVDPDPCLQFSGCGEPVIWCATSGAGHDRQDDFAPAIADFLRAQ